MESVDVQPNRKMLLLHGDPNISDEFERAFKERGWRVLRCSDPRQTGTLETYSAFDVIVVEADPFDPNSISSVSEVRQLAADTYILAHSSFSPGDFECLVLRAGADLHIKGKLVPDEVAHFLS